MDNIAIVIPTNRPDRFNQWIEDWFPLIAKYNISVVIVRDEKDEPHVELRQGETAQTPGKTWRLNEIMGDSSSLIIPHTASVRNLGFAFVAKQLKQIDYIITLDDDESPFGDTIRDHINALDTRACTTWVNTLVGEYPRGFPYGIRDEAETVVSHGVWEGVLDLDAPTQLIKGSNLAAGFFRGTIPKGVYAPISSMNLAFKRKMLPYMFMCPMSLETWGMDRFDDIWGGILAKESLDDKGWCMKSGYAKVNHARASNVFTNLKKEAAGLEINEWFFNRERRFDTDHPYLNFLAKWIIGWQAYMGAFINES